MSRSRRKLEKNALNILSTEPPIFNISALQPIDPNTLHQRLFEHEDFVMRPQAGGSREKVGVKMGKLYFEYQPGGKGSFDLTVSSIHKNPNQLRTLFNFRNQRYSCLEFEDIVPFDLGSFSDDITRIGTYPLTPELQTASDNFKEFFTILSLGETINEDALQNVQRDFLQALGEPSQPAAENNNIPDNVRLAEKIAKIYYVELGLTARDIANVLSDYMREQNKDISILTDEFLASIKKAKIDKNRYELSMILPEDLHDPKTDLLKEARRLLSQQIQFHPPAQNQMEERPDVRIQQQLQESFSQELKNIIKAKANQQAESHTNEITALNLLFAQIKGNKFQRNLHDIINAWKHTRKLTVESTDGLSKCSHHSLFEFLSPAEQALIDRYEKKSLTPEKAEAFHFRIDFLSHLILLQESSFTEEHPGTQKTPGEQYRIHEHSLFYNDIKLFLASHKIPFVEKAHGEEKFIVILKDDVKDIDIPRENLNEFFHQVTTDQLILSRLASLFPIGQRKEGSATLSSKNDSIILSLKNGALYRASHDLFQSNNASSSSSSSSRLFSAASPELGKYTIPVNSLPSDLKLQLQDANQFKALKERFNSLYYEHERERMSRLYKKLVHVTDLTKGNREVVEVGRLLKLTNQVPNQPTPSADKVYLVSERIDMVIAAAMIRLKASDDENKLEQKSLKK